MMISKMKEYFVSVDFDKYFKELIKKTKDKSVIIYGSGILFQYVTENYDLSLLNIIGISDMKFLENQEGNDYLGYKIIPKTKIINYKPDIILVATLHYIEIIEDFELNYFKNTKTRVYPLVKKKLFDLIKEIWER